MVNDNALLERAREIASRMHAGQVDKLGEPYVGHCERVAARLDNDEAKVVALLHDVLEDTGMPESDLRAIFGNRLTDAVVLPPSHRGGRGLLRQDTGEPARTSGQARRHPRQSRPGSTLEVGCGNGLEAASKVRRRPCGPGLVASTEETPLIAYCRTTRLGGAT